MKANSQAYNYTIFGVSDGKINQKDA